MNGYSGINFNFVFSRSYLMILPRTPNWVVGSKKFKFKFMDLNLNFWFYMVNWWHIYIDKTWTALGRILRSSESVAESPHGSCSVWEWGGGVLGWWNSLFRDLCSTGKMSGLQETINNLVVGAGWITVSRDANIFNSIIFNTEWISFIIQFLIGYKKAVSFVFSVFLSLF